MNHQAIALAAALACSPLFAQQSAFEQTGGLGRETDERLKPVMVTANPLASELFELVAPASVLQGDGLATRQAATLGGTLAQLPGVSGSGFGPAVSRPVLRGLDGDRVRLLDNGSGMADASALSFDHGVAVEPLLAERIEVVRGPAALLYGGNAIGGVVNVIDNRIPQSAIQGVQGRFEGRVGGADSERATGAVVEAGNGRLAVHGDVSVRRAGDLRIPGYARSARLRATEDDAGAHGRLPNSDAQQHGGALGASLTGDHGYFGIAVSTYHSKYGALGHAHGHDHDHAHEEAHVEEPPVRIDLRQERVTLAGEARNLARGDFGLGGLIESVRGRLSHSDYRHDEIENGAVATTFRSRGTEGRIEARHARLGEMEGVWGLHASELSFSAVGEEAFVPSTRTSSLALFAFEEVPLIAGDALKLNFGGRIESTRITSVAGGRDEFIDGSRRFTTGSASVGLLAKAGSSWTFSTSAAYTERAPTFYELYANGPHIATMTREVGDPNQAKERALSLDLGARYRQNTTSAGVTVFASRYMNFIALRAAGEHEHHEHGDTHHEAFPEYAYGGVPALMLGLEAEGRVRLADRVFGAGALDLEVRADLVRATNRETREALPRIPPLRLGGALAWKYGPWGARAELDHAARQARVPADEAASAAYTMIGMQASRNFKLHGVRGLAFIRGDNLTNVEARPATSFLRDVAPLGARSVRVGLRLDF